MIAERKIWKKPTFTSLSQKSVNSGTGFDFAWESRNVKYVYSDTAGPGLGTCVKSTVLVTPYPDDEFTVTQFTTVTAVISTGPNLCS